MKQSIQAVRQTGVSVPDDKGPQGIQLLTMMGQAACVCASRRSGSAVILARADSIALHRQVSAVACDVRASILFEGRSSMTVAVEVPDAETAKPSASGRFMLIAVDDSGLPIAIPPQTTDHTKEDHS